MAEQATQLEQQIEKIVRDVLAQLGTAGTAPSNTAAIPAPRHHADVEEECGSRASLVLGDRLVTLNVLAGRLDGIAEVRLPAGAVVTPSARDALRERKVRLVRQAAEERNSGQRAPAALTVGVAACTAEAAAAARLSQIVAGPIEHLARMGLVDVVEELVAEVALGGSKGLLFTDQPAAALCLANRRTGVRAVTARSPEEGQRASACVGANLLILQPTGLSIWQQLQIARSFVECGVTQCPAAYRAALG